ncbi:MAG: non-ribosomal peptide synthetase, partial [bacterium]|nr:non-ribosomal peptide synthetase [bacterium]
LGGHSLLAAQVITRVRTTFGIELPLRRLFEKPTVAALGQSVEAALAATDTSPLPAIEPVPRHQLMPLSFAQQQLWFLDRLEPGDPTFNMPFAARVPGALDRAALARSLGAIVERHEALRTSFPAREGKPCQRIAATLPPSLPLVDLRRLPREASDGEARRLTVAEGRRPFDVARGPLLRATLVRSEPRVHLLLLTMHHIIADGWSIDVLLRELSVLYAAFSTGRPSPLPELRVQYADCAAWQRRWLGGEALAAQRAYWRQQLAGPLPVLELPVDGPRRAGTKRGATCSLGLPESLAAGLRSLSREADATLFMTLLAAFDTLLHRTTGQIDLVVGTPVANRNRGESEGLIGLFVNTLVLRTDLRGDPSFRELLGRVREVALGAYAHSDLPFEKLVEELHPQRASSLSPLFQVMMTLHKAPEGGRRLGELVLEPLETHSRTSQFDLTLVAVDNGSELDFGLEYDRGLFEPATAERMLRHFRTLLEEVVADSDRRLSELALAGEQLRRRPSEEAAATEAAIPTMEPDVTQSGADSDRQARLSQRRAGLSAEKRELLQRRLKRRKVDPS